MAQRIFNNCSAFCLNPPSSSPVLMRLAHSDFHLFRVITNPRESAWVFQSSYLFGTLMACPDIRRIRSEHLPLQSPSHGNSFVGSHLTELLQIPLLGFLEGSAFFPDADHQWNVTDDGLGWKVKEIARYGRSRAGARGGKIRERCWIEQRISDPLNNKNAAAFSRGGALLLLSE
jgi:hypothetical protein